MKKMVFIDDGYPESADYDSCYLPLDAPQPFRLLQAMPDSRPQRKPAGEPSLPCDLRIGSSCVPCGHAILTA